MTRSQFGCFCAGIAAGAVGYAKFPTIKEKVSPLLDAAAGIMKDAFSDAVRDASATAESFREATVKMTPETAPDMANSTAA